MAIPGRDAWNLFARRERYLVQLVGLDGIPEVRGRRKVEVDAASRKCGQHLPIAHVLPGAEGTDRNAEGQAPRGEMFAPRYRLAREPVSFEYGVGEPEFTRPVLDHDASLRAAGRNRDVVSRCRGAGHLVEFESIRHQLSLRWLRRMRCHRAHHRERPDSNRFSGRDGSRPCGNRNANGRPLPRARGHGDPGRATRAAELDPAELSLIDTRADEGERPCTSRSMLRYSVRVPGGSFR